MHPHFYFVELYSGNGSIARTMSKVLGVEAVTLDMDAGCQPDIVMDVRQWTRDSAALVKARGGVHRSAAKRAIIWASPPCTEYSKSKTTGVRDLEYADQCVAVVQRIAADLDAAVVLIENPATGLLKDREVIRCMPVSYEAHYCQYGFNYRKPTMIWSSIPLSQFAPCQCPGWPACGAMFHNKHTHLACHLDDVCRLPYQQRIAVPDRLVNLLARALAAELPALVPQQQAVPTKRVLREARRYQVNYIRKGCLQDGELLLQVYWVGYDAPTWISADDLSAEPGEYDYIRPAVRDWVLDAHARVVRHRQKQAHRAGSSSGATSTRSKRCCPSPDK